MAAATAWWHISLSAGMVAALVLAGCGGGGGDSGPPSPPPIATKTGLVPAAPPLGNVLETDATTLRVLRTGATWTYHGVDRPFGPGSQPVAYTNVVTHGGASVGVNEQSSNLYNQGNDIANVRVGAGSVRVPDTVQPVSGVPPEAIDGLELRSPVRVDDQYTVYDRHFDDSGHDLDGDGIRDALDVAIWSRVVGEEILDLPNRRQVRTVRVDTTLQQRVRYSRTGDYSEVVELVRRQWYARGIGIVKTELEQPGPNIPSVRHVTTEVLDTWDGLTEGVGHLPVQVAVVPMGESAGLPVRAPLDAVAFDTHAVVMSHIPGFAMIEGVSLTTLDLAGRVKASTNQRGMAVAGQEFMPERLLRLGGELRLLVVVDQGGLAMLGFDASGSTLTLPLTSLVPNPTYTDNGDGQRVQAAAAANRLWMMWLRPRSDAFGSFTSADLVLRGFDAAGTPLGPESVLEADVSPMAIRDMRLSADADRLIATWGIGTNTGHQRYAVVDTGSGAVAALKTVLPIAPAAAGDYPFYFGLRPLAMDAGGLGLVFKSDSVFGAVAGVRLDASFDPLRSTAGTLGNEVISPSWMLPNHSPPLTAAGFGRAYLGVDGMARLWPDDTQDSPVQQLVELVPGSGALASTGTPKLLARVPAFFYASILLPYPDRLLVVGTNQDGLVATAAWRQP